jgi:hypothetical protein
MFDGREGGSVRLVRRCHRETVLAEQKFSWKLDQPYELVLRVKGGRVSAAIDGVALFDLDDRSAEALKGGGVALIVDTGSIATDAIRVMPI